MAPNPRAFVLVVLIFFLLFSTDPSGPTLTHRFRLADNLEQEYAELGVLNHSRWGDFDPPSNRSLNLTGFRTADRYAWQALVPVRGRLMEKAVGIHGEEIAKLGFEDGSLDLDLPVYRNVSGFTRGRWVRSKGISSNLRPPLLNRTELGIDQMYSNDDWPFHRNVTGESGTMRLQFLERDVEFLPEKDGVKETKAQFTIHDPTASGDGWEILMYGLHYVDTGLMVLTTTSDKFAGIFGLPHLVPSEVLFDRAKSLLNETIREIIEDQADSAKIVVNPWSSASDGSTEGLYTPPRCEYVLYLLQHPLNMPEGDQKLGNREKPLDFVENELRQPTGYLHLPPPDMKMEAVIFSPDCGFVLESQGVSESGPSGVQHLSGPKLEIMTTRGRWLSLMFGALICCQIYLTLIQMKEASTPSTRSRISFYAIAMLSMGDGFTAMAFLPLGMFIESMFLNFLTVSFFSFLSVTFLDLRFLMDIWTVQDEERRRQERQWSNARQSSVPNSTAMPTSQAQGTGQIRTPQNNSNQASGLPLPATARRDIVAGATPIVIPSDQDDADNDAATTTATGTQSPTRRFGALYTRFYAVLLVIVFLSLHATSWPLGLRSAYSNFLALLYLSPWIPQIYRNTMRNCRKALLWKYVIGHSVLRLIPVAYFYGVYDNVIFVENDRRALLILTGWVWLQIWTLFIQNVLGPRVFVKDKWVPPAYDYHPLLREDEEGLALPVGFTQAANVLPIAASAKSPSGAEKDRSKKIFDCAICMQDIEVQVVQAASGASENGAVGLSANILARRTYMVTPCRHIFHTNCLEGWMRFRLQCPICRETLPPL